MIHDKHCICALLTGFVVPLCHASKVFPKCSLPNICRGWIMHEFFVTGDDLPADGMYHWISVMFKAGMGTSCFTAYLMRIQGVHMVFIDTFSLMVSTLIACCVTIRCWALLGIVCTVVGKIVDCVIVRGDRCHCGIISSPSLSGIVLLLLIIGTPPGMLFLVTCLCIQGVFLSACFDMGLQACMIGGASMMR